MVLSKAIRWPLLACLSWEAWSHAIGSRGAPPADPELRLPERAVPEAGVPAPGGRSGGPVVDLGSLEVTSVEAVAPEMARALGYPGFGEGEGRPLSPRELDEAVREWAAQALNLTSYSFSSSSSSSSSARRRGADNDDDVRVRFDPAAGALGVRSGPALAERVINARVQPGFAESKCEFTRYQIRPIDFKYRFDQEHRHLRIQRSETGNSVGMGHNEEMYWQTWSRLVDFYSRFTTILSVRISTKDGLSWCCTIHWRWLQKFQVQIVEEGDFLIVVQPEIHQVIAEQVCLAMSGLTCSAHTTIYRSTCVEASVRWGD